MRIARIDRGTGVVVNIECADQAWVDAHADDPAFDFQPYEAGDPVAVGGTYDPETGFVRPEATVTVTEKQLADAGLDAEAIETLSKS